MNNLDLELKIKELLNIPNYFDMVLAAKEFEAEYKKSDYYKATKQPLLDALKEAGQYYHYQFEDIVKKIQKIIDNLDMDNVFEVLDQISETFGMENEEIRSQFEELKSLREE